MSKLTAIKNFLEVRWLRRFKSEKDLKKYQEKMLKKHTKKVSKHMVDLLMLKQPSTLEEIKKECQI